MLYKYSPSPINRACPILVTMTPSDEPDSTATQLLSTDNPTETPGPASSEGVNGATSSFKCTCIIQYNGEKMPVGVEWCPTHLSLVRQDADSQVCDYCQTVIPFEKPYVFLSRNIEVMDKGGEVKIVHQSDVKIYCAGCSELIYQRQGSFMDIMRKEADQ